LHEDVERVEERYFEFDSPRNDNVATLNKIRQIALSLPIENCQVALQDELKASEVEMLFRSGAVISSHRLSLVEPGDGLFALL